MPTVRWPHIAAHPSLSTLVYGHKSLCSFCLFLSTYKVFVSVTLSLSLPSPQRRKSNSSKEKWQSFTLMVQWALTPQPHELPSGLIFHSTASTPELHFGLIFHGSHRDYTHRHGKNNAHLKRNRPWPISRKTSNRYPHHTTTNQAYRVCTAAQRRTPTHCDSHTANWTLHVSRPQSSDSIVHCHVLLML